MKLLRRPSAPGVASDAAPASVSAGSAGSETTDLLAQRDRLTERFALMQSELGGLFYEMAIRDHVRMDVLVDKAAALQKVDTELAALQHLIDGGGAIGGQCPSCGTAYARGAAFCSQCAAPLGGA